jgi:DsbC/DsbD-like thiol-disulfide interchange protein
VNSLKPFLILPVALLTALSCLGLSAATSSAAAPVPHGTVTLVSENNSLTPGRDNWLGLHFVFEPGWHTYWTNPGDAGTRPHLTWKLPSGFQAGPISWPTPERLPVSKLMDFGYQKDVTLLVPIHGAATARPGNSAQVNVQISVVVCKDLCVPGKAQVSLALPIRASRSVPSDANATLFAAARSRLPKPLPAGSIVRVAAGKSDFVLTAETGKQPLHAFFFPLEEGQIDNAAPQQSEPVPKGLRLHLKKSTDLDKPITRLQGVLSIDGTGYLVDAPVTAASR